MIQSADRRNEPVSEFCDAHNLPVGFGNSEWPFGIRVTLPADDPMRALLGKDWVA